MGKTVSVLYDLLNVRLSSMLLQISKGDSQFPFDFILNNSITLQERRLPDD